MTKQARETLQKAVSICKEYNEGAWLYITDIFEDITGEAVKPCEVPEDITAKLDILGDTINILDVFGRYGVGDLVLDTIGRIKTAEGIED